MLRVTWVFVQAIVYFCRDHLFVVEVDFMHKQSVSSSRMGAMMAVGYAAYPTVRRHCTRTAMVVPSCGVWS